MSDNDPSAEKNNPEWHDPNRDRAMLTRTDRQLLLGEKEYDSEQALRNARHRVREHIRDSLNDAQLVASRIDQSEFKQIENRQAKLDNDRGYVPANHQGGVMELALRLIHADPPEGTEASFERSIETVLARRTKTVIERLENVAVANIDVDISLERRSLEDDQFINDLIFGNPEAETVWSYLMAGGGEQLFQKLQELDAEITTKEGVTIGPDHSVFNMYTEDDSD